MRSPSRVRHVAGLLAALIVVSGCAQPAASGTVAPEPRSSGAAIDSTPPPLPAETAWSRALAAIGDDGRFSLDAALTLFATAYGPLPGVDVAQDLAGVADRSIAIRAVMAHRDALTDEQRAAVDRALAVPAGADTVTIPPVGTVTGHVALAALSKDQQEFLRGSAKAWREQMAGLLGRDFLGDIQLTFIDQPHAEGADADAWSDWPGGVFGNCRIRLYANFNAALPQARDQILAHEVFHCFQLDAYRTIEAYSTAPAWVIEGQAEWVAASIIDWPNDWWIEYLQKPRKLLTTRAYDAIGFYAHLAETGTNPWSVFVDMWQAGSSNIDIYTASQATTDAFLDSAASAVVLLPNLSAAWTTGGAGMVSSTWGYRSPDIMLANGGRLDFVTPMFANDIKTLNIGADTVHITVKGHARLADGVIDTTVLEDAWYCVEGHTCESACPSDGPAVVFRGTVNARFLLAMAGGLDGTTASIEGVKFESREPPCDTPEPTDGEFCDRYRDYVAWSESLPEDTDVTRELAAQVATRFEGMWPVAPPEMVQWVELVFTIYAAYAGFEEPYNIPVTGHLTGIQRLPEALMSMHAYCGIPWPAA